MLMVYSWLVTIRDLMCIVAIIMWDSPNAINNYHLGMVYTICGDGDGLLLGVPHYYKDI